MHRHRNNRELIEEILEKVNYIMDTIDELVANVEKEDTAIDSAVILLNGLTAQIASLKSEHTDSDTAAKIDKLSADVKAKTVALSAAVVTNTPVVPPVTATTPVVTAQVATDAATASTAVTP